MLKGKELLLAKIKEEKEGFIGHYDKKEEEVLVGDNPYELYKKIIDIDSGMIHDNVFIIKYLGEILEDDFFKKAEVVVKGDEIDYMTDNYVISIPKTRLQVITVNDIHNKKTPKSIIRDRDVMLGKYNWIMDTVGTVEDYLNNKTVTNLKKLRVKDDEGHKIRMGSNNSLGNKERFKNYVDIVKYYDGERLKTMKKGADVFLDSIKYHNELIEKEAYNVDKSLNYISSIEDLLKFEDVGYTIRILNEK